MEGEMITTFSLDFVRSIHLGLTLITALLLIALWLRFRKKGNLLQQDWGFLLIAFALIVVAAVDFFKIFKAVLLDEIELPVKVFSAVSNALLIAALPFFKFGFEKLKSRYPFFKNGNSWALLVLLFNFLLIIFYLVYWDEQNESSKAVIAIFDTLYSMLAFGLLAYAITYTFFKRSYGWLWVVLCALIAILVVFTQLSYLPFHSLPATPFSTLLLIIAHSSLLILLLLVAHLWSFDIREAYYQKIVEGQKVELTSLGAELEGIKAYNLVQDGPGKELVVSSGQMNYLKFYKSENALVVELTMLGRGIIGIPIYASLRREYKDLLRFAVYKKAGIEIRSVSGMHRDFGEIYKANLDIRKVLLNPTLKKLNLPALTKNDLIIQKIKGSGIYTLDCVPKHILIDTESLSSFKELRLILEPIL